MMPIPIAVDYTILEGETPAQLTRAVVRAVREGWQPHGSMVVVKQGDGLGYYQPMVLLESGED